MQAYKEGIPIYSDTVTIFNKYEDQTGAIHWYPHVLSGVDLIIDKAANVAKTGLDSADTANLHVKYHSGDGTVMVGDKPYLSPKEWEKQPNDDLPGSITFASGDFFMQGEYAETPILDSDYANRVDSGFYDYINKRHDYVFLITTVGGPYTVIPHFEIGGN